MTDVGHGKLKLPPEETQSSYERVLEWNNQTERDEISARDTFKRRPGSLPNNEHHPEHLNPLRDDMALPNMNDSDLFDVIAYGHGGPEEMEQGKSSFVNVEDVSEVRFDSKFDWKLSTYIFIFASPKILDRL